MAGNVEVRLHVNAMTARDLSGLDQLQADDIDSLWLGRTEVNDAGLRHVARLSGLKFLDLSGTRITDEGIKHLGTLK